MNNFIEDGNSIDITNGTSDVIKGGDVVALGDMVAVAVCDILKGATGTGRTTGVYSLPKLSTDNIAVGKTVYLASGKIQLAASSATPAGRAWAAAAAGSDTVQVRINA